MVSLVFTSIFLQRLKPNPDKQFERFDRKVRGLGVRVSPGGAKSFFLAYRIGGLNRRLSLGRYPTISLSDARQRARDALSQISRGIDPAAEKMRTREGYKASLFPTVLHDFIENYAKRKTRSWREADRILRKEFRAVWRKLPISQITKPTVNSVLDAIVKRGAPSAANHAFAAIRKFFNWCVERGYLDYSPCTGMKAPSKVVSRDRVLSDDEIAAVWLAADKMGWPFGPLVKLLILTGQRRSEVAGLRWEEVDLLKGLWELPPGSLERKHKSERRHLVPLSSPVEDALKSLPFVHDEIVFPARGRNNPVSGFSKLKRKLDALSGVRAWRLHDLRRTVSTGMAALGVPLHITELILNHRTGTLGGVAGIYNRFQYLDDRRDALERWSQHVEGIIRKAQRSPEPPIVAANKREIGRADLSPRLNHMSKYRGV